MGTFLLRRNRSLAGRCAVLCLLLCLSHAFMPAAADTGGVSVQVPAGREECFIEDVNAADVKVFLHFLVTSGGSLDIDTSIYGPDDSLIWESSNENEGRVLFKTRAKGFHTFCFSNEMSTFREKVVTFSIMIGESNPKSNDKNTKRYGVNSLERTIMRIEQGLREVQEVQGYLKLRERKHRSTTETANMHVVLWSTVEIMIIAFMGVGNVWYMRRIFNKRRVV